MKTLREFAKEIAEIDAISGSTVLYDSTTDNIIVHDGKNGFVVTRTCLEQWPFAKVSSDIQGAWESVSIGNSDYNGVKILPKNDLVPDHRK